MSVTEEREARENNQWRRAACCPTIGWGLGKRRFPSGGGRLRPTFACKVQLAAPSSFKVELAPPSSWEEQQGRYVPAVGDYNEGAAGTLCACCRRSREEQQARYVPAVDDYFPLVTPPS